MYIEKISEPTDELYRALQHLIPQLGIHKIPPTREDLQALINSGGSTLLIAREQDENGVIVGVLCLTIYRVPTGIRSIIEDVVVDEKVRRHGIGEALVHHAISWARDAGAGGISLTSNLEREAANKFYQALGFELRKTNAYYYKLK